MTAKMKLPTANEEPIRVMIADDHPIVRQGLALILASQNDMELIATAEDGNEAVQEALETNPDVIIMDIQMPEKDGITAIQEILEQRPELLVLVLTSFPDDDNVYRAIQAGAMGYVLKDSSPEYLIQSIRQLKRGQAALHPGIARKLILDIKRPSDEPKTGLPLTPRELELLNCLARGLSNRQIAEELSISIRTVSTHIRNILDKLDLPNRTKAALYAVDHGLANRPKPRF